MTPRLTLRERLSTQRALLGLLQAHPNPTLTEIAALSGHDFVMLDDEHGCFDTSDYIHALQVLVGTDTLAFIRLSNHDGRAVGSYLDFGADAIVVPDVSTAEQAQALVRAMSYPPSGTRGIGAALHRVTRYGPDHATYLKSSGDRAALLVIIESALGAANAREILSVPGVAGVIIGPADLSASLGHPGDFSQPGYAEAFARVEQAAYETGKFFGTAPHPGYATEALLARGHRILILGSDVSLIGEAMRTLVSEAKSILESLQR